MEAVSIATELRLRTYANNDTREETLRTYEPAVDHLTEEHKHKLLKETCHFQDTTILHHFYYIILRVQNLVKMFCSPECQKQAEIELMYDPLFGNFNYNKGMIYARFLEYDKAIEYMQAAQKELPKNLKVLEQLYFLYGKTRIASTVSIAEEILHLQQHKHQDKLNINIAITYNNLGVAYAEEGNYRIAIKYSQSALDIYLAAHQYNYVAVSYSNLVSYGNLGDTYRSKGEYDKAAQSFKKALSIHNMVHEGCLNHPGIAANYNNLGLLYIAQNDCKKAINYFKRALEIYNVAYARCPNHPDIAMGYNNLGFAHTENEEYEEATLHFRKALSIYNIIYSGCSNHPDIAASYNNLGFMYGKKKKYDEAVEYCQKSLDIYYIIYTKCPNHPDIAMSYNNLGNAYADKGEYEQAIEYHEQTLAIRLKAYEANSDHPDIAMSYNNLGVAYANIGEYKKSIDCFKMALDIRLRVYEQSPNHPVIADSYNNLGEAYSDKGEYEQAEKYYQDALEMYKKIYKTNLNHHKIVNCQNSLIETKVIKSFSDFRKKVKDENDDTKIIINTKGLAEEDIKNYCKAKFDTSFSFSSITFEKNECYITLDKNCREILSRQIVMQELSNNSNDIANLPIKLSRDIANFQDIPYKEDGTLRVISYNITADYYDSNDQTEDKHHHWSYRAPFVKMLLKTLDADIICLQELSPSQALELHQYFSTGRGYSSIFLSQTPSDVEVGTIVQGEAVKEWCGKFMGTPLVGIFLSKLYKLIDKGRFWLNETPDTIPENFDRGTTDKGFNNVNTYKAVLWAKVQMDDSKILFVFNSHYPFSGDSKTRLECAKLEMAKVKEITRGDNWVSAGDRNFVSTVQDNEQYNPQTAYEELVKEGRDVRDAKAHYGISTSWLGFSYDKCKNEIKSGDFTNDCVLDVMVSSLYSKFSFCHHGAFNPVTRELVPLSGGLNEEQNEGRYFSSDHALVGADLFLS
jgi:tetratricopeptide (TPR) repeat protein/endonuclease/exonuclease/phosphatase family metal-dependent hydrolase